MSPNLNLQSGQTSKDSPKTSLSGPRKMLTIYSRKDATSYCPTKYVEYAAGDFSRPTRKHTTRRELIRQRGLCRIATCQAQDPTNYFLKVQGNESTLSAQGHHTRSPYSGRFF